MICPKCGSEGYSMGFDGRGIPEARCTDCGSFIKKMSTSEVISYFNEIEIPKAVKKEAEKYKAMGDAMPCKFCKEPYFIRRGRLGTVYTPVEIKMCPMCGRPRKPDDLKY